MQDFRSEDREFDKVAELLTPKHPRKNEFSFAKPQKGNRRKIWTISGIAAMLAIVLTFAAKSFMPVSATEVVNTALATLSNAESFKIDFTMCAERVSDEAIYEPQMPPAKMIDGTLYILKKGDRIYNRVDWHDDKKNTIVYNGTEYMHFQDGKKVSGHPSRFYDELLSIVNLDAFRNKTGNIINESDISTDGNIIIVKHLKNEVLLTGEFNKDNKQLIKASAVLIYPDGKEMTLLETKSIETDIEIPETMFSE